METPVILSAVRTPIGKFQGGLAGLTAPELGAKVVAEAIRRAGLEPKQIDEVIMGNVVQAGLGQNPARQAALKGGCDSRVAAMTINKVCGSGLKAVGLAAQAVQLGESEIVVAGGMESMSNCPYLLPQARTGYRIGDGKLVDSMIADGLWDAYENFHMGMTGELVAEKYGITREEQDKFAYESHQKAVRARKSCFFEAQILPIEIPQKKGDPIVIKYDESPREDTSIEALAKLKPAFKKDGTVTAGNAPGTNDGAAALVVTSERNAARLGKQPIARIVAQTVSGVEPKWVMMAPVDAVEKLLKKTGWDRDKDIDLVELNEAFSVAAIAVTRQLKLNPEKVNVNGGAVALGHPIGASGARILVTLLYELQRRHLKRGVAALCLGGGERRRFSRRTLLGRRRQFGRNANCGCPFRSERLGIAIIFLQPYNSFYSTDLKKNFLLECSRYVLLDRLHFQLINVPLPARTAKQPELCGDNQPNSLAALSIALQMLRALPHLIVQHLDLNREMNIGGIFLEVIEYLISLGF